MNIFSLQCRVCGKVNHGDRWHALVQQPGPFTLSTVCPECAVASRMLFARWREEQATHQVTQPVAPKQHYASCDEHHVSLPSV